MADKMRYAKICMDDIDTLKSEGWTCGAYWSEPGLSGYYLSHDEHGDVQAHCTPCSDDSLEDEQGFFGPRGAANSATEALLDRCGDLARIEDSDA